MRIDGSPCLNQIFSRFIMTEETRKAERLKSIFGINIDQFWITCEVTHKLIGLSSCSSFEDGEIDGLFSEKVREHRFLMICRDQDWAEAIFPFMDQT